MGKPNKNFKNIHNKKRNSQYRYYQANTQNNDYDPRIYQADVKYSNNNNNYNKFSTNDKSIMTIHQIEKSSQQIKAGNKKLFI